MGDVPMCPMGYGKVSTVLMCPMVGRLEWDMGDGLDSPHVSHGRKNNYVGVGHGGWFGQSPCVPW